MRVEHLSLRDFRNYATAELTLSPGANLLVGRNGQGKTNLVEAIAYFSSLRSHRVSSDGPLVRAGCTSAFARLRVSAASRNVDLDLQINRDGANRAQVNGNGVPTREVTRWFAAVSFVPEDLTIVRGEPSLRRRFLDEALVSRHPAAAGVLQDYDRVLRQRTALLKSARGRLSAVVDTLPVWDEQLVSLGAQIMLARREYVHDAASPLVSAYASLVGEDHGPRCALIETALGVSDGRVSPASSTESAAVFAAAASPSASRTELEAAFRLTLASVQQREIDRGVTLVGPHRDDLSMFLNDLPVKGYASHGESWSFALGLKLALAEVLREHSSAGDPVLILDDVFAELDQGRRDRLMRAVTEFEQVIVTAAVESDVPADVAWNVTHISKGAIVAAPVPGASPADGDPVASTGATEPADAAEVNVVGADSVADSAVEPNGGADSEDSEGDLGGTAVEAAEAAEVTGAPESTEVTDVAVDTEPTVESKPKPE